jgi:hypothetical protein
MATKRYAFVNYGGQVMSVETRCSGRYKKDVGDGELALEQIIHPDMLQYYVEITDTTGDAQQGYLWSDGKFAVPTTVPESVQQTIDGLGQQMSALTLQLAAAKGGETT